MKLGDKNKKSRSLCAMGIWWNLIVSFLHYLLILGYCRYPKCPPLQLFSARIPCGHLTDVHAEYWNTMSATSAWRKKNYQKKRADVRWNSCLTILRMQRTSVGHPVPILRIRWNFMRTRMSVGLPPECPSDVRQNVRRTSARMSAGCPLECVGHQPECPMDFCRTSAMSAQKNVCENSVRVTSPLV